MTTLATTLTSKGQITLPVEIRRQWNLVSGDDVEFFSDANGRWFVRPLNASAKAFFRDMPKRSRRVGVESDDTAIERAVTARNATSRTRRKSA